ncbi:hypothetical protein HN51_020039, partial [Arachis hypogaea]
LLVLATEIEKSDSQSQEAPSSDSRKVSRSCRSLILPPIVYSTQFHQPQHIPRW